MAHEAQDMRERSGVDRSDFYRVSIIRQSVRFSYGGVLLLQACRRSYNSLKHDTFTKSTVANQEVIIIFERREGLKMSDHFYRAAIDVAAWMYDGLRCINCGYITAPLREGMVADAVGGVPYVCRAHSLARFVMVAERLVLTGDKALWI